MNLSVILSVKSPLSEASYLAQVRRLRNLAETAISQYPVHAERIDFIHHGENTTFRVHGKGGIQYLLRIHRPGYHTKAAIQEELVWLSQLSHAGHLVPKPVFSKRGTLVETVMQGDVAVPRNTALFVWIEGRFIRKSVRPKHLYAVGKVLAELQSDAPRARVVHRRYWTSEGLVGAKPKFGSIDSLACVHPAQQALITKARK